MDAQKVDLFVMTNQKYFPAEKIVYLKDKLLQTNESKFNLVTSTELKDPTTILLVSIFLGALDGYFEAADAGLLWNTDHCGLVHCAEKGKGIKLQ